MVQHALPRAKNMECFTTILFYVPISKSNGGKAFHIFGSWPISYLFSQFIFVEKKVS